jgi:hypothetical protein
VRRRWPLALTAALLLLISGALVAVIITSRTIVGAVPGRSPILGMAALDDGFLVGTSRGAFVSRDGVTWSGVKNFSRSETLVADGRTQGLVLSAGTVWSTRDLSAFDKRSQVGRGVAMAVAADDSVYVVKDPAHVLRISGNQTQQLAFSTGPEEILSLASVDAGSLLAGGLTSGLWESRDGGVTWRRLLQTPTRAIMGDPVSEKRIFIATAGGILVSNDEGRRWRFTGMRMPVEALAEAAGRFFALSTDRLVYTSTDGVSWSRINN